MTSIALLVIAVVFGLAWATSGSDAVRALGRIADALEKKDKP